ncbi:MAG: alpha/beta hydrolase [Myxococcales bacterium]|nr:MAG: alpha/beta hydrolase [Myxococcales bacterium]
MQRINAPIEAYPVIGRDGVRLMAFRCGTGPHRWLLTPGLGTPVLSWKYLFEHFHRKMTIITWDPRGCYQSAAPDDPDAYRVEDHVEDADAILEHAGWVDESFVTGGWSMGIEIGLELYRRLPNRVAALTLINGAFEHVLRTAFALPKAQTLLRGVLHTAVIASPLFAPASHYLLGRKWALNFLKSLGIVAANADFFAEVASEFRMLNFANYFRMILKLDEHSARAVLPDVAVPTLITAGDADKMTPLKVAEYLNDQITGSELFIVPDGTHYTTLEFPEMVNERLEQFFRTRVFPQNWE